MVLSALLTENILLRLPNSCSSKLDFYAHFTPLTHQIANAKERGEHAAKLLKSKHRAIFFKPNQGHTFKSISA
jgi:hypothetical protein